MLIGVISSIFFYGLLNKSSPQYLFLCWLFLYLLVFLLSGRKLISFVMNVEENYNPIFLILATKNPQVSLSCGQILKHFLVSSE